MQAVFYIFCGKGPAQTSTQYLGTTVTSAQRPRSAADSGVSAGTSAGNWAVTQYSLLLSVQG